MDLGQLVKQEIFLNLSLRWCKETQPINHYNFFTDKLNHYLDSLIRSTLSKKAPFLTSHISCCPFFVLIHWYTESNGIKIGDLKNDIRLWPKLGKWVAENYRVESKSDEFEENEAEKTEEDGQEEVIYEDEKCGRSVVPLSGWFVLGLLLRYLFFFKFCHCFLWCVFKCGFVCLELSTLLSCEPCQYFFLNLFIFTNNHFNNHILRFWNIWLLWII